MTAKPTMREVSVLPANLKTEFPNNCLGVLSIFAGGVFWETEEQFWNHMYSNDEYYSEHRSERLLELRAFSAIEELHLKRSTISKNDPLRGRLVCDDGIGERDYLDECQLLDIDEKKTRQRRLGDYNQNWYVSTGGGEYVLPGEDYERVRVRNYITYDENGVGQVMDFRIIGLISKNSGGGR